MGTSTATLALEDKLRACGVLPVVALPRAQDATHLAGILVDAGIPGMEVTFRAAGAPEAIDAIRGTYSSLLVVAGTVLTTEQARAALDAGAQAIVAPGTDPEVIEYVRSREALMVPGVATPSEILVNLRRGIGIVKLFPAEVLGGVGFLRAMHGPFPSVRFVPTGGVTQRNLEGYLSEPNVLACGGTWIAPAGLLAERDWAAIEEMARAAAAIVRKVRPLADGSAPRAGSHAQGVPQEGLGDARHPTSG
jgi:2-dehydro-3-deoxyphosphogluconate aldolase/(4S)-4-hydroxy-2-oxoglutarate aldolase